MIPPVVRLGDAVIVSGPAVGAVAYAVAVAQRSRARNGLPVSGDLAALAVALAPVSANGQTDTAATPSVDAGLDGIEIAEAARRLGCSPRTARRLAPRLGGRRVAGRWLLDPQTVAEHRHGKAL